ncbi:MAG: NUDIX domain-containing protein [Clostridia bacterium]|nr:NUDIX domain-containing protein [Clostridia bacterium]
MAEEKNYNLIVVYSSDREKLLMCRRLKEPYKGLSNFVGGKIEEGEDGLDAAYRELWEETSVTREQIRLTHLMDFYYALTPCRVEVYVGRLKEDVKVHGDENKLYWSDLEHDFFDMTEYAGEGNIGHILEHVKMYPWLLD